MVIDKIENYKLYEGLGERIAKGLKYIKDTDLLQTESGTYKIDGDNIFAMVQEYDTKELCDAKLEGHFKYIDIQYVIRGVERMGVTPMRDQALISKNDEDDYAFYEGDAPLFVVEAGMFAIFFPGDLHMPCIKVNEISNVKKVVVKVRV